MQHRRIPAALALALALLPGGAGAQQVADSVRTGLRLGFAWVPPPVAIDLRLAPADPLPFAGVPFPDYVAQWSRRVSARLAADRERMLGARFAQRVAAAGAAGPGPTIAIGPPPVAPDTALPPDLLGGTIGQYADLGMRVTGVGELGSAWQRYDPCDPAQRVNCNPGLFPTLRPDVQFGVQVAGTISDRVHVNVDYDQRREDFSAANNINVFYQGMQDEVLQRVEIGDVSLRLPQSRYLTRGVPAGNFGLTASGRVGPLDFQTVFAQQRGDFSTSEFRLAAGGTEGLVQDESLALDDADYVKGQFFLLVDPARLARTPQVDVLQLVAGDAPAAVRPAPGGTLELYRDERIPASSTQQAQLGLFLADARAADGTQKHTGLFRRLVPGEDYLVHSSGLWIALRSPLRPDEALALAYVTETGDTVGTVNAERNPPGRTAELRLLRSPAATHQPGSTTWAFELHNIYRINASSGVELPSLGVTVSLGDPSAGLTFKAGPRGPVTFLRLLGLDDDSPADAVDQANVWQPSRDDFGSAGPLASPVNGTFLVFPTLEPFRQPPAVPVAGLDAAAARALLGADANPVIYEAVDPVARDGGARFRITFRYRVRVEGLLSTFSLGQFGIRENTERLSVGDVELTRGTDYTIDYDLGIVTLSDPQSLFALNPGAEIRATWEQRSLFEVAPTAVFGAAATYRLGAAGALNFVGIYQSEKTLYTRPQLGVEPGSILLGGASANLRFDGAFVDRALANIPGLRNAGATALRLDGEVALSAPNPNRRGAAFLDDFEATDESSIDLRRQQWRLGARPNTNEGDDGALPAVLDATTAAPLVWQHDIAQGGAITGSLLPQRDIDNQINVAGNAVPEPALWLTFGAPGGGVARWRSITTVLSTTGRDMSRAEFLELYVRATADDRMALVLDVGTVGEDALYVDAQGRTSGSYPDGRPWGLGTLDAEASLADREIWGPDLDARGLWDQACTADPLQAYPLGDARSNCTRGNGLPDTEDLDANGILEADDGALHRFVVTLDRISPWLVRDTAATGTGFRLYRIPLRAGIPVNGASEATWRFVKHLRVTVAGEPAGVQTLVLARFRIIGSRWTKRDVHGVVSGLLGDLPGTGASSTNVRVGPVSQVTDGLDYTSPPGVRDQLQDPTTQFGGTGIEFNEKSLRIAYDGLLPDERAEAYLRYPQQPRNFMTYRQLRLWVLPREGRWGVPDGERLLVRVGTDPRNYYLFQTTLRAATGDRPATPADWTPEIVIDFGRWFDLKAEAERRLIERPPGVTVDTVWSADSAYAVVLEDRARAPNLAAVRELVFAVYNGGAVATDGEVWIDEMRLTEPLTDPGAAGNVTLTLDGDFLDASVGYASRGALFRQLGETPGYRDTGDLAVNATARLDRFLPADWGMDVPLTVSHTSAAVTPEFLEQSDVRADRLPELRETGASQTRVGLRIDRQAPSEGLLGRVLLDPVTVRLGFSRAHTNTIAARAETSGIDGGIDYRVEVGRRAFGFVPGFVAEALRALVPAPIEESDAFRRLLDAELRWTPARLGFGVSYYDREDRALRFDRILVSERDSAARPIESPRQGLENRAELALAPFDPLTAAFTLRSGRDLLEPGRASTQRLERSALEDARGRFLGVPLGWETDRTFGTNLAFRPRLADWLRFTWTWDNRYGTARNPAFLELLVEGEDTTATLQRRFGSDRQVGRRIDLQPAALVRTLAGDSVRGPLLRMAAALQNVSVTWNGGVSSQFERATFEPGAGYRFGIGDLESFRIVDGDTAVQALERDDVRVQSTLGLPLSALLSVGYMRTASHGFDVRGGERTAATQGWPNLRLAWRRIPVPGAIARLIPAASASAGWEHTERKSTYGRAAQDRISTEDRYPLELSLTLARGITATYSGSRSVGASADPTGRAEQDRSNHTIRLGGSLAPPEFLQPRISQPIQTSLLFSYDGQAQCRYRLQPDEATVCVPYIDSVTRTINLTIDTTLSDLIVGIRGSWTDRQSRVGTRTGSSQFQLALFGQFNFAAGRIPEAGFR